MAGQLRQASTAARDALAEARLTLLGLASSPLNGQTLDDALRSEAAWAQSMGGLEVRYVTAGTPAAMDERLAHEVLRVAREALTNIVRHAQARSVRLGLLHEQAAVTLLVQDDGQGFDPKAEWQGDRFGLRAISERARTLGATVEVDSLAGWGTRIRARFPYQRPDEQAGPRLRVLVAAARPLMRAGIVRLLSGPNLASTWSAKPRRQPTRLRPAGSCGPTWCLSTWGCRRRSGGGRGVAADDGGVTGLLLGHDPGLAVVGLCEVGDEKLVASAMRAGALGCVDMGADGPELARALVAAGRGQAILSGPVLQRLHRGLRDSEAEPALTDRERQVRGLMEQGLPDKLIAEQLVLSIKTVEKHRGGGAAEDRRTQPHRARGAGEPGRLRHAAG